MTVHAPDAFFGDGLTFLARVDPAPPAATPQIVDTFALARPVAASSSVAQLRRHLTLRLARLWLAHAPPALPPALPPLDRGARAHPGHVRTALARQQRRQAAVSVSSWVVDGITPHLPRLDPSLRTLGVGYLSAIAQVPADELTSEASGHGQERPATDRGDRRIISAVDREATFRKHDGSEAVLGSNAVISTTRTRIRACVALTGCTPDSEAPSAVLVQQHRAGMPLPPQLVMDQAAGWGKVRASVDARSAGQSQLVAWVPTSGGSDRSRFTVADFAVDPERTRCICPHGLVSTKAYAHGAGDGISLRFLASQCRDCPLWSQCRAVDANPKGHRSVFISAYHAYLRAADAFNQSGEGRAWLASRWQIEPTVAWLVRYQGCRRARRVGQAAAQCQVYQACALRNLLLWLSRVRRGQAARPAPW